MGPLERQSETAREYLKKKEELKTYDINMFLLEEERLRERIRAVSYTHLDVYKRQSLRRVRARHPYNGRGF